MYASVGLAVVVPAALLVSLALLALGTGSFSLSSLKQVISGPSAPAVQPVALAAPSGNAAAQRAGVTAAPTVLAAVPAAGSPGQSTGAGSAPSHNGAGVGTGSGSGGGSGGSGGGGGSEGGGSGGSGGGHSGGGGSGGGGGGHHPPSHPTVVDRVVGKVTPVTSKLPAPIGPIVTQVVKSAGSVADQILHRLPVK